jgi:hypothetical protein
MNVAMKSSFLLVLVLAPALSHAIQVRDLDDLSLRTGYVANFGVQERLRYDADADQLTFSVLGPFDYSNRLCGAPGRDCIDPPIDIEFGGLLAWTAGVDANGRVKNPGSMIWMGDFGNGLEALASGHLIGIGANEYGAGELPFSTRYGNLQFLFDLEFLDQRVAGMGNQMILLFEQEFMTFDYSIFARDFDCGRGSGQESSQTCWYWSTSGIVGREVPEPSPLALILIALGLAPALRRGSQRSQSATSTK